MFVAGFVVGVGSTLVILGLSVGVWLVYPILKVQANSHE